MIYLAGGRYSRTSLRKFPAYIAEIEEWRLLCPLDFLKKCPMPERTSPEFVNV